jgi:hypothetical protein
MTAGPKIWPEPVAPAVGVVTWLPVLLPGVMQRSRPLGLFARFHWRGVDELDGGRAGRDGGSEPALIETTCAGGARSSCRDAGYPVVAGESGCR